MEGDIREATAPIPRAFCMVRILLPCNGLPQPFATACKWHVGCFSKSASRHSHSASDTIQTQTNVGCEMEALLLIAIVISMFGDGGGKAGW